MVGITRRLFAELYHWQNFHWGASSLPALTALLYLSILQFLNVLAVLMIIQNLISINLAGYFSNNLLIGMIIPASLLLFDYLAVKPIEITIKDNSLKGRGIPWIYVLATLLLLALCVAWTLLMLLKAGD